MARTLDDYRRKLIHKILLSSSAIDACRFTETAVRSLNEHRVHGYIIVRFIEKAIYDLDELYLRCNDTHQQTNIRSALDHFRQLRRRLEARPVS